MKFKDILQFLEYDHFLTKTRFIDEVTNERAKLTLKNASTIVVIEKPVPLSNFLKVLALHGHKDWTVVAQSA